MIWILIGLLIILVLFVWQYLNVKSLVAIYERNNTITFGKKGSGKDLIFQKVINTRKVNYYANMPYTKKGYEYLPVGQVNVSPNTYEHFINNNVEIVPKTLKENMDYYISDGGIILPSHYDSLLSKLYPSLPIAYALSRQLWLMNIHINTQSIGRVWLKLREQADGFIKARGVMNLGIGLLCFYRTFEKQKSAENDMSPMVSGVLSNKYTKGEKAVYDATNGVIKNGWFFIRKSKIVYDTRYYHKIMFGVESPKKVKTISIKKSIKKVSS